MWIDSHCHLQDCDQAPPAELIGRARGSGVTGIVVVATEEATSRAGIALAHAHGLWASAGVHPTEARGWGPERAERVDELAADDAVVALGETGLDFHWDTTYVADQRAAFSDHIAIARRRDKAVVIHTRKSVDAALDAVAELGPVRAVFHCWSGDGAQLERAVGLGAYVSFAGNVTFKNAGDARALVPAVPRERLLIETDSPYLAPEPHRGRPNEPALAAVVGAAVARIRGEPPEEVAAATAANAAALFGSA